MGMNVRFGTQAVTQHDTYSARLLIGAGCGVPCYSIPQVAYRR